VAADDKAATGQLPAACHVPWARAPQSAALRAQPYRERYAWLYDDEDIWAVVELQGAPPDARGDDRRRPRG
jgi:hypothetical protein